ncbi:MAG: GMC family oxidoreductase [Kiritimatiellae bacterium]|jgi:choline dehydrogenase-like flavoprotein|nr:GMC family oxidoreductase [Kiritimatiellia bacterium]
MSNKHVNVIVVGAGAGGGVVAKVLSEAGLSVVLLERGRWQNFHDITDDELVSQRTPRLTRAPGPENKPSRKAHEFDNGRNGVVVPNNVACVGSGTMTYGAMAWRYMPQDFRMKSIYGPLDGSTLDDWPISYEDLEHCYERAEWEVGVSGDDTTNPFAAKRNKPRPMPAFPYDREARMLIPGMKRLGWHPFPVPMLRNSIPYGGRPQCIHMRSCCGFACPINAKCGTQNTVIPAALATGLCELRTDAVVSEVMVDDQGRARGVKYYDINDRLQEQTADLVVLSAAASGTARILLNSKSKLFPNGAGNNNDWVGRNIQGHCYVGAYGLMDEQVYEEAGPRATVAFCDFNHGNPGLHGGGMLANDFILMPYAFSRQRPPGSARWGLAHKKDQREMYKHFIRVVGPVQEMPVFDARVMLDPKKKDYWGIPLVRNSGYKHLHDAEIGQFLSGKAEQLLKEIGAKDIHRSAPSPGSRRGAGGGQHQAGTCRMGNDPKSSVTNRYGQVHEIDNLFVADGSLNVTNGGFNPALSIMALGFWVGEYIAREWQGGGRFRA